MMSDQIADFLTRMRNAIRRQNAEVSSPSTKIKVEIARILKERGFINDYKVAENEGKSTITVFLKYNRQGEPVISVIRRVSKPGCRIYSKVADLARTKSGTGLTILSTPRGLVSDAKARRENVGGEVICQIW